MKRKMGLLSLAAFLIFAISLIFTAGNVQAAYLTDGASITTSGTWEVTDPGYCVGTTDATSANGAFVKTTECTLYAAADSAACTASAAWTGKCTDGVSADSAACVAAGYKWVAADRQWTSKDQGATSGCFATFTGEKTYSPVGYEGCLHCHNEAYLGSRIYCSDHDVDEGVAGCTARGDIKTDVYMADGHYYRAMEPFMQSGHKNVLRKVVPGGPMGGPLFTAGAGSAAYTGMDWSTGKNTSNGLNDDVFYIYNGWFRDVKRAQLERSTIADPTTVSQVSVASQVRGCFYCHTGGYGFAGATEGVGTSTTWAYNGIHCDTCHGELKNDPDAYGAAAGTTYGQHHAEYANFVNPAQEHIAGTTATRMCMTCHRYESTAGPITDPAIQAGALDFDGGVGINHKNFGAQFLNSPHARFTGTWGDITDPTAYGATHFTHHLEGVNDGCIGCHEVHVGGASADVLDPTALTSHMKPSGTCGISCHTYLQPAGYPTFGTPVIAHPAGPGTPLDGDLTTDKGVMMACVTCHMGPSASHFFRISTDATYETFTAGVDAPNSYDEAGYAAVGMDLDLACGQCHGTVAGGAASTKNGAPYIAKANIAPYAQIMHGGVPVDNGLTAVEPVLPPTPGSCDSTLAADGTMSSSTGTVGQEFTLTDTTTQAHSLYIYWGDGTGITSTATHSYNNIGTYQIIQTVTNPCGYRSQKVHIVTVTGGTTGKGTMTLSATGSVGSKLSYSVLNSSGVSITNGTLTVGADAATAATKVITLDGGAYGLKIGYSSVMPLTDPVTYKTCDLLGGAADVAKCSRPGYADQASCEAALHVWQITGQTVPTVPGITVTGGADMPVTLINCN